MDNFIIDPEQAVKMAQHLGDTVQKVTSDRTNDPRQAQDHGASAAASNIIEWLRHSTGFSGALSYGIQAVRAIFAAISQAKTTNRTDFDQLAKEILSDLFQVPINSSAPPPGNDPAALQAFNNGLGRPVVDLLEAMMLNGASPTAIDGEQAARTFLGFGIQFAVTSGFIDVLSEAISLGQLKEWAQFGDELIESLGLGRLNRIAMRPLLDHAVAKPYNRQMAAKYRQDLLGVAELARAVLRNADDDAEWRARLAQHGYSDDQIAELLAQHFVRVNESDEDLLTSLGTAPAGDDFYESKQNGSSPEVRTARMAAVTWKRLNHARERVLSIVLSQISQGFLQPSDLDPAMTQLQIPADEQALWRIAAGYAGERTRKRLSQGDMEFLYEAAQINQGDVLQWAAAEGYSAADQQRILLLFELKATAATAKSTGGAAAKAAGRHAEHVAYVTDEITGLWGRAPSTAELAHWVSLLDSNARTRSDVKTELKALPTTGPAIPA